MPAAVLTAAQIRYGLAQFGWNEVVADWVATQVPFRVYADLGRGWGLFYPGYYPSPGYLELAPDFKAYQIEHEARHAVYWAYGKGDRYGADADLVRADLAVLEAVPGDVGAVAREGCAARRRLVPPLPSHHGLAGAG